jgi:protease-4
MVMGRSAPGWLGSPELAGARSVAGQLRRARQDPEIKAVVLRVDSPGGSAQAADIMTREVELLRKAGKPVIASVGHVAASGGYYLICGADRIFAAHNSVLGSIGIVWGKFVLTGLYGKLGLATETVKTAPHADGASLSRPWDSTETAILQRHMDQFYARFTGKVAAGRKLTRDRVDSLAQGRIYTGSQAVRNGLADSLGGLDAAIREAARRAGIPDSRRVELVVIPARHGMSWSDGGRASLAGFGRDATMAQALRSLSERYASLTEAQLFAVSPELSGWTGDGRE